ncbi:hypothetical protein CERSUDRAFT_90380 [Gelatoporia subvermispora B]|uniref:Uncharacterized protein n=1 Tax=Ceriporiopsis subvermispora (strain B) TaxID=914234 RepID=M2PY25_CERS8|nr:hypothetical protein CERSUDRAFT_90380 [Gelatoporia subvermispora B]
MPSPAEPPYYVLVSHRQSPNEPPIPVPSALSHPTIEYHYADDSHHSLLPQFPGEHVIVLDYDPVSNTSATAKSLSTELAVTALRLTDPPGAGIAQEQPGRNGKMHIIETTSSNQERPVEEHTSPQEALSRFKQRNMVLRQALEYPEGPQLNGFAPGISSDST